MPLELSALLLDGIEYDRVPPLPEGELNFRCILLNEFDFSPDPVP